MTCFGFQEDKKDRITQARTGVIHTPHGDIETPAFVPVGTQASVKSLTPEELQKLDVHLFFVNTYHMVLRPGLDVITKAGGLHRFMGWDGPIITDSGGFQVFSLGREKYKSHQQSAISSQTGKSGNLLDQGIPRLPLVARDDGVDLIQKRPIDSGNQAVKRDQTDSPTLVKITDDGVTFRSHWDGSLHTFTPESSMQYQWTLGSDIHIAFDDCTPYGVTEKEARKSMDRTHRWAKRSLEENRRLKTEVGKRRGQKSKEFYDQALYGSIQGSVYENLRKESAKCITSLPFDGYAIGGVAVGESKKEMCNVLDWVTPLLPPDKPRHLLGVGEIDDIFTLIEHGMDTFDCVQPTRLARMGRVYCHRESRRASGRGDLSDRPACSPRFGEAGRRGRDCFVVPLSGTPRNDKTFEIDILKAEYAEDMGPIEKDCPCYTCQHFSRAYMHHLFKVRELLGYRLATIHNISFINRLVREIRLAIADGSFVALKKEWGM